MKKSWLGILAVLLLLVPAAFLLILSGAEYEQHQGVGSSSSSSLKPGSVPPQYEAWVIQAGSMCADITPPVIAAQIEQESNWNPKAVSPTGAEGLSQFEPYTWPGYGRDEDGNGRADPFDPADAIMAQGRFDCSLAALAKKDIASGRIKGPVLDDALAGYNCGYGCVQANGGPDIHNGQTDAYVSDIKARMVKYESITGGSGGLGGPFGRQIIMAAMRWIGTPYAWAGGTYTGPSEGSAPDVGVIGFDCSGLTMYAVAQASNQAIHLPHYTGDTSNPGQLYDKRGQEIPLAAKQPGDLIYFGSNGNTHHVGIYYGQQNGKDMLLNAPESGEKVSILPLSGWTGETRYVRRFGGAGGTASPAALLLTSTPAVLPAVIERREVSHDSRSSYALAA